MLIAIPPKRSVATIVGFLKGNSSIWVAQNVANKPRNFIGHKCWARGYSDGVRALMIGLGLKEFRLQSPQSQ
jgi:REP element-mobilizing transposase RayT